MEFRVGRARGEGRSWIVANKELMEDMRTRQWRLEPVEDVGHYDQTCDTSDEGFAEEEDEIVIEPERSNFKVYFWSRHHVKGRSTYIDWNFGSIRIRG